MITEHIAIGGLSIGLGCTTGMPNVARLGFLISGVLWWVVAALEALA